MADDIKIRVIVENEQAARQLKETDAQIAKLTTTSTTASTSLGASFQAAHQKLSSFFGDVTQQLGGTKAALVEFGRVAVDQVGVSLSTRFLGPEVTGKLAAVSTAAGVSTGGLLALAGAVAAVGAAISIGIKQVISYGSAVYDLSQRTGLTTSEVQSLGFAAKQSSTAVETVTRAVTLMSRALVEGDKGTVTALKALGLELDDLVAMSPGKAFESIADAIQKIPDPMKQSQAAMELFGRSAGVELLPLIKEGVGATREEFERLGLEMGENTVKAADDTGDAMGALWEIGKSLLNGFAAPFVPILGAIATALSYVLGPLNKLVHMIGDGLVSAFVWVKDKAVAFYSYLSGEAARATGEAARQAADLAQKTLLQSQAFDMSSRGAKVNLDALGGLENIYGVLDQQLQDHNADLKTQTETTKAHAKVVESLGLSYRIGWDGAISATTDASYVIEREFATLADEVESYLGRLPQKTKAVMATMSESAKGQGAKAGETWGQQFGAMISKSIIAAVQGGGNVGASIGGSIGGSIGTSVASAIGSKVGSLAGGIVGSVLPVVGTMIGAWVGGKIGGLVDSMRQGTRVNDLRDDFIQAAGGLEYLNEVAAAAGVSLDALFAAQKVKDYDAAVEALTGAINKQIAALTERKRTIEEEIATIQERLVPSWDDVDAALGRYGISLDKAGLKVNQLAATASWRNIVDDINLMERAGIDVGGMLEDMSDEISALVVRSMAFGTTIPANMKPYIEELMRAGKLVGDNGVKITDLSGIKWGDPLKSEGEKLNEALLLLVDTLKKITEALDLLSGRRLDAIVIPIEYGQPGYAPPLDKEQPLPFAAGGFVGHETQYLASGGRVLRFSPRGSDTVPAMLTPGEFVLNREAVSRIGVPKLRSMNRGASDGASTSITVNVPTAYFDSPSTRATFVEIVQDELARELRQRRVG